jgi:Flp pilus assembly protein CpaB
MATAAILGFAGMGGLHLYLRRFEDEIAGGERRSVVMATRDLELGEVLTHGALDVKDIPESYLEERHILGQDLERALGARVTSAVAGGGAVLWTDLDAMQDGHTLSGLVRVGMRAFTLPERDLSFDGLLRPGDRVDVVFTPGTLGGEASVLVANVLVLTVGGNLGQGDLDPKRDGGHVTLSVSPEQANLLAQREGLGRMRLSLRNPEDALVAAPAREQRAGEITNQLADRGPRSRVIEAGGAP